MQINFKLDLNYIIYNKIFLSLIGSICSILILYIYKCIMICNKTNKWSYIKLFILNFLIIYMILYIYSTNNNNNYNEFNNIDTTTPPEFDNL